VLYVRMAGVPRGRIAPPGLYWVHYFCSSVQIAV